MDENVHGAITIGLRLRDVDVLTVQEDGYSGSPDPVILDRSTALGRIVFTQDRDLILILKPQHLNASVSQYLFLNHTNRLHVLPLGYNHIVYSRWITLTYCLFC